MQRLIIVFLQLEGFRVADGDKPYEELSDCKLMVYGRGYLLIPSKSRILWSEVCEMDFE